MRNKSLYILMLLMMIASLDASAQRKRGRKPAAKKKTSAKATAKKSPLQRNTNAGDTALKGATIEIIQAYKPQIKTSNKPELEVNLPPVDTTVPPFTYEVPQQTLSYNYTSFPLRPLALGTDSATIPYYNYVKVGGGNLSTLMLDAGIGSLRGDDYETQFHVSHLSQSGNLDNQKVSLTGFEGDGTLHRNGNAWHGSAAVFQNQYNYYGSDNPAYKYPGDSVKQAFTGVKLGVDMKNEMPGFKGLDYNPLFTFSLYSDRHDASERSINLGLPVSYTIDTNLQLSFGIHATLTQFENALQSQANNILQFTPSISYRKNNFKGAAGLYPTIGKGGSFYMLPDIKARFMIPGSQYSFKAGWQSKLRQNTYEELSTRNPYMFNTYTVLQTQTNEVYAGIEGNIGTHISFSGKASWWQYNDLPLFVNDTFTDNKQFSIAYDTKVNALSLQAVVRYQVGNTFTLGLSGTWQDFYNKSYSELWHEPGVQLRADAQVKPLEALTITGYFSLMDEIYALDKNATVTKLKAIADLGASSEYQFIPKLSAFLQVNNLLNGRNERWLGYPAFGTNVFGGIRLKF